VVLKRFHVFGNRKNDRKGLASTCCTHTRTQQTILFEERNGLA